MLSQIKPQAPDTGPGRASLLGSTLLHFQRPGRLWLPSNRSPCRVLWGVRESSRSAADLLSHASFRDGPDCNLSPRNGAHHHSVCELPARGRSPPQWGGLRARRPKAADVPLWHPLSLLPYRGALVHAIGAFRPSTWCTGVLDSPRSWVVSLHSTFV